MMMNPRTPPVPTAAFTLIARGWLDATETAGEGEHKARAEAFEESGLALLNERLFDTDQIDRATVQFFYRMATLVQDLHSSASAEGNGKRGNGQHL